MASLFSYSYTTPRRYIQSPFNRIRHPDSQNEILGVSNNTYSYISDTTTTTFIYQSLVTYNDKRITYKETEGIIVHTTPI
jgi:hypothetical protein